jgi:hypothetical protein
VSVLKNHFSSSLTNKLGYFKRFKSSLILVGKARSLPLRGHLKGSLYLASFL